MCSVVKRHTCCVQCCLLEQCNVRWHFDLWLLMQIAQRPCHVLCRVMDTDACTGGNVSNHYMYRVYRCIDSCESHYYKIQTENDLQVTCCPMSAKAGQLAPISWPYTVSSLNLHIGLCSKPMCCIPPSCWPDRLPFYRYTNSNPLGAYLLLMQLTTHVQQSHKVK